MVGVGGARGIWSYYTSDLMVGCMVVGSCMHALPTVYMTVETCLLHVTCTNLNALFRLQLQLWLTPLATSIIEKW